ncbi:TRAP transporter substrate-binding protein DctP, partial [Chloroflexota bacterium]
VKGTVPEADGYHLSQYLPSEEREMGLYDLMNDLFKERLNIYFLGRAKSASGFWIETNKKVSRPQELAGQKLAADGLKIPIPAGLGAVAVSMATTELYDAMSRGLVDGCVQSLSVAVSSGDAEVVKYLIDYQLFEANNLVFLINLDTWNRIPKHLQKLLIEVEREWEVEMVDIFAEIERNDRQALLAAGMELITFSPEDAEWYINAAYDAAFKDWAKNLDPGTYQKLKDMMTK